MAKIVSVAMGRPGHFRINRHPDHPDISAFYLGVCECGAKWCHDTDREQWGTFSDWVLGHQPTRVRRALGTEQCTGSGGLIYRWCCDENDVGFCTVCNRYRPTSPQHGYDGIYRQFDPHPLFVQAVTA